MKYSILSSAILSLATLLFAFQASGLGDKSTAEQTILTTSSNSEIYRVQQSDTAFLLDQTAQSCAPFCSHSIARNEGVQNLDELDLIKFMARSQQSGKGLIVDARSASWYQRGTIPGSVNIPVSIFEKTINDVELSRTLEELGALPRHNVSFVVRMLERIGLLDGEMKTSHWDFSQAKDLVLMCNDPWCGQSPRAIKALLAHGYPAEKLYYYRGGLKSWESLGLTTQIPDSDRLAAN